MDADNLVVKLCVEGMQAETERRHEDARKLFEQAWEARQDDYDACIAAHYLARHQDNPQAVFEWNRESLARADALKDDSRIQGFYPSLYLNMGHSYETLGNRIEARRCYEMATEKLNNVPDGAYKDIVRNGITGGFERTESAEE
jgi:tetratricopeptide (TPR) repeat protein